MNLVAIFNEDERVVYNQDDVVIETNNLKNIERFLKDKQIIKEQLELEENMFSLDSDDMFDYLNNKMSILLNGNSKKKLIKNLNKYLEQPLELNDFKSLTLIIDDIDDLIKNKEFVEKYEKNIFIDFGKTDFNENMLNKLKTLKFLKEPLVTHQYNNGNYYLLDEFLQTLDYSLEIKSFSDKYCLSTLEKIMFIYDYLKDRVYKKDKIYKNSSDLNKVIKGDSIVCSGFVNIFSSVCNFLGIHTEKRFYYKKKDGHVTNICYIKDDKYNFSGVLEFDVTWDSKKEQEDKNEDSYNYYGLSLDRAKKIKESLDLIPSTDYHITDFERIEKSFDLYEDFSVPTLAVDFLKRVRTFYINLKKYEKVKELTILIDKINNEEISDLELNSYIEEIDKLKSQSLDSETFLKVFLQTRRIEHFLNPKKYNYDKDTIFKVLDSKYKKGEATKLLISIFGEDYYQEAVLERTLNNNYFSSMNGSSIDKLKLDKERLELANVITKINGKGR